MGKKGIPDKWLDYSGMGKQIPGTRFIAFKVPLKESLLKNLPSNEDYFDTRSVMDHISNLGMVIDLTNTDRYYDPTDFRKNNVTYQKIKVIGHVLPNDQSFVRFCYLVENFLEKNKDNDKIIGVHCTHGLNRTGYIICRYMIQQLGVAPDQVISDFQSARGYPIERENYLEDLRKASWPKVVVANGKYNNDYPARRQSFKGSNYDSDSFRGQQWSNAQSYETGNTSWNEDYNQSRDYRTRHFRSPRYQNNSPYNFSCDDRMYRNQRPMSGRRDINLPYSPREDSFTSPTMGRYRSRESLNYDAPERSINCNLDLNTASFGFGSVASENADKNIDLGPTMQAGKEYYQRYFGDQTTSSQYDMNFYSRRGGGIGPHRPPPRYAPAQNGANPRQYRGRRQYNGPRQYTSPPRVNELEHSLRSSNEAEHFTDFRSPPVRAYELGLKNNTPITPANRVNHRSLEPYFESPPVDHLRPVEGPGRFAFSPGARSNVFSPENELAGKRRRFQPY